MIPTDHRIPARRPNLVIVNKKKKKKKKRRKTEKKRTCRLVDFAVLADHRMKLNEKEWRNKDLNLDRVVRKLWNMKVTVIPIITGTLGAFPKGLV